MRRPRLRAPEEVNPGYYHCVSRVVNRERVLGSEEKEQFVRYMRVYEELYGLRVLSYCIMSNHFHILVEVPSRPPQSELPGDGELVSRVRRTLGRSEAHGLESWLKKWRAEGNVGAAEAERERYFRRMWDVSQFMKVLKQRFSQWFNGRHRRRGTLWEERFRSVLVERGDALRAMAAYIDLNPLRAGVVADPRDYRWCGYAEACAGGKAARKGLLAVGRSWDGNLRVDTILAWYRCELFGRGQERFDSEGRVSKKGFSAARAEAVVREGGALPRVQYLRLRIRYFTDGAALGGREFVEKVFRTRRRWFSATRQSGARRLRGLGRDDPLRTLRALSLRAVGTG